MTARSNGRTTPKRIPSWDVFADFVPPGEQRPSWSSVDSWVATAVPRLEAACAGFDAELQAWNDQLASCGGEPSFSDWSTFRLLRTSREEDWSDWLAYLLLTSRTGALARRVLGPWLVPPGSSFIPAGGMREERTTDGTRRADIVLSWPGGQRTCIEVKVSDCSYEKTDETARGVRATWSVILLPPEDVALWADVSGQRSVTVVRTWRDVASGLRASLWGGREPVSWRVWASGLLGKVEQELLGLPPLLPAQVPVDIRDHLARHERFQLMREARQHDK